MKIDRKKVSIQIFDYIKEMMKSENMQPGDRLPTESRLTEMFGVSRTPVREALSILEASGLIVSKQGGGSVVQSIPAGSLLEETPFEFIDPAEIVHVFETRLIVESGAARLAAERRSMEDLQNIERALGSVSASQRQDQIGHDEDIAFHREIAKASHNSVLIQTMENISTLHRKAIKFLLMNYMTDAGKRPQLLEEHDRIFDAIKNQEPSAAENAMNEHLTNAKEHFTMKRGDINERLDNEAQGEHS
ncbi:FadR/GntR family transcriptional regulator [Salibacterium aidingense]|uniref:FadR/GntR family transcriptional regulator n=1 Tax=Salibacterium aidingense TaxID=384933 RepID=UPI003BCA74BB